MGYIGADGKKAPWPFVMDHGLAGWACHVELVRRRGHRRLHPADVNAFEVGGSALMRRCLEDNAKVKPWAGTRRNGRCGSRSGGGALRRMLALRPAGRL